MTGDRKKGVSVYFLRVRGKCAAIFAGALLAGCAGNSSHALPVISAQKGAINADSFMRSITPKATLPNTVSIPPMQDLGSARSPMSLRKPQSAIMPLGFSQIPGAASQVAASPDGSSWVLGDSGPANGDQGIYHLVNGTYVNVAGAARRIAVAPDNTPWVVNAAGGIYHLVNGAFTGIAGGASEISVGGTVSAPLVDVISNQSPGPYGAGIYQYNVNAGTWTQLPGAGVTVAASIDPGTYSSLDITPGGFYVTNANGGIYYYNPGIGFEQLPGGAVLIAPTANGGIFALGDPTSTNHGIYYNDFNSGQWTQEPGAATSLSASATAVYAVGIGGGIYVSQLTPISALVLGSGAPLAGVTLGPCNPGCWGPRAIADAFEFPVQYGYDGTGTTVAIINDSNIYTQDLKTYEQALGIPVTSRAVGYTLVDNASSIPGANSGDPGTEATLDVETVAGLAPGASIDIYIMPSLSLISANDALNRVISDGYSNVVSYSVSGCESNYSSASLSAGHSLIAAAAAKGIAVISAAGDQGNACYLTNIGGQNLYVAGVGYPASDPAVIAVGGTESNPSVSANPASPIVWNDSFSTAGQLAGGGGVSAYFALPSFQSALGGISSAQYRNLPDVSMPAVGAALYQASQGGWSSELGTSWGTPQVAAMLTEIYQYCKAVSTDPPAVFYGAFSRVGYSGFIDVTTGNNRFQSFSPFYAATTGYDDASGIGMPLGAQIANALCPNRVPSSSLRSGQVLSSAARLVPGTSNTVDATPRMPGLVDHGRRSPIAMTQIQFTVVNNGLQAQSEQLLIAALTAAGFTITQTFSNHLLVDATGPSGLIESFFGTTMHDVAQSSGRMAYAPFALVSIPASLAPYISGAVFDSVSTGHNPPHNAW